VAPLKLACSIGNGLVARLRLYKVGLDMRMVTFGQPLQGVHLIDKPCPQLWTTWSMFDLIIEQLTPYIVANNLLNTCVVI
jgi:hypothetical protein